MWQGWSPTLSKGELLRSYLEERGARIPARLGWVKISCINKSGHPRGDRNPSASVNLTSGYYKCFGCDMGGDVYDLLMSEQGLTYREALDTLGGGRPQEREEPTWL